MTTFAVLVEKAGKGFSAYSPDVPGCVATGRTRALAIQRMRRALASHLEMLRDSGEPLPRATTTAVNISVAA